MKGTGMAFALAVLMLIGLAHPAAGQSAVQLKDVQVEQQNDSVTVKLWTTGIPTAAATTCSASAASGEPSADRTRGV